MLNILAVALVSVMAIQFIVGIAIAIIVLTEK